MCRYQPEIEHVDGKYLAVACSRKADAIKSARQEYRKAGVYEVAVRDLSAGRIVWDHGPDFMDRGEH